MCEPKVSLTLGGDASLEDPETETNSESEPSDNTVDGASQDSQDLPKTVEAMEITSEPESVPREEGPDVEAMDTAVPPEEGSKDEEAMEITSEPESVPREEGPDVEAVDTAVPPEEGSKDEEAMETTSEPESVPREEGPDVEAVDTAVPQEGSKDEEATETIPPTEPLERGVWKMTPKTQCGCMLIALAERADLQNPKGFRIERRVSKSDGLCEAHCVVRCCEAAKEPFCHCKASDSDPAQAAQVKHLGVSTLNIFPPSFHLSTVTWNSLLTNLRFSII